MQAVLVLKVLYVLLELNENMGVQFLGTRQVTAQFADDLNAIVETVVQTISDFGYFSGCKINAQ